MKRWLPSASLICAIPPPMMPTIIGSTTVSVNRVAIAASIALPPAASISAPEADASGWLLTTMPRLPAAPFFLQVNVVAVRFRQFPPMIALCAILLGHDVSGICEAGQAKARRECRAFVRGTEALFRQ